MALKLEAERNMILERAIAGQVAAAFSKVTPAVDAVRERLQKESAEREANSASNREVAEAYWSKQEGFGAANRIAEMYSHHGANAASELMQEYEAFEEMIARREKLTNEELERMKKLERPYQEICRLRETELKRMHELSDKYIQDQLSTQEGILEEHNRGQELVRRGTESDEYNKTYDRLKSLSDQLASTDLDYMSQQALLSKELHNLLQAAAGGGVTKTAETISAGGLRSISDFQYDSISIEEKNLKAVQDILRAASDASDILGRLESKLPSPIMAQ